MPRLVSSSPAIGLVGYALPAALGAGVLALLLLSELLLAPAAVPRPPRPPLHPAPAVPAAVAVGGGSPIQDADPTQAGGAGSASGRAAAAAAMRFGPHALR